MHFRIYTASLLVALLLAVPARAADEAVAVASESSAQVSEAAAAVSTSAEATAVSEPAQTGGYTFEEGEFEQGYSDDALSEELDDILDEDEDKVKFALTGYYRVRGIYVDEPDADRSKNPANLSYFQHRLWLKPELTIKNQPKVRFVADVLVGEGTSGCQDPSLAEVQVRPCDGIWGAVGGNVLATSTASKFANISLLRVWGEALTPIGVIRAGRQPSQWGLGLFSNDGEQEQLFGDNHGADTYDRIAFATKPLGEDSNLILALVGDQVVEDSPSLNATGTGNLDDVYEAIGLLLYKTDPLKAGFYQVLRTQDTSKSKILISDIYSYLDIGLLYGGFEMYWVYGNTRAAPYYTVSSEGLTFIPKDIELSIWNWAAEVGIRGESYDGILRFGSVAGDSDSTGGGKITGMSLNANYRAGLIMWDYANANRVERALSAQFKQLDYLKSIGKATDAQIAELQKASALARTNGAINNAFFLNPVATYYPTSSLRTRAGFLWATANDGIYISGRPGSGVQMYSYGYEIDLDVAWTIKEAFEIGLQAGYFMPGDIFKTLPSVVDPASGQTVMLPGQLDRADPVREVDLRLTWTF